MGITGKYSFPGIQKAMGVLIDGLLAGTTWGAWILASPFRIVVGPIRDAIVNFLANQGLIILNIGANIVDGTVDQAKLDAALDAGIQRVMQGRDKITPAEGQAIDDKVRKAFDAFVDCKQSWIATITEKREQDEVRRMGAHRNVLDPNRPHRAHGPHHHAAQDQRRGRATYENQ